jgi:hypothetical protein
MASPKWQDRDREASAAINNGQCPKLGQARVLCRHGLADAGASSAASSRSATRANDLAKQEGQ